MPVAVRGDVPCGDLPGVGHLLGQGVIAGQLVQLPPAEQVGRRVADVGDEAGPCRGSRPRVSVVPMPASPGSCRALLDERLDSRRGTAGGPGDHLLHLGRLRRFEPKIQSGVSSTGSMSWGSPSGSRPPRRPSRPCRRPRSCHNPTSSCRRAASTVRQVRHRGPEEAAEADDQEVVLVVRPDLALMGPAGEIGRDRPSEAARRRSRRPVWGG